jgi:hypothetical protein
MRLVSAAVDAPYQISNELFGWWSFQGRRLNPSSVSVSTSRFGLQMLAEFTIAVIPVGVF